MSRVTQYIINIYKLHAHTECFDLTYIENKFSKCYIYIRSIRLVGGKAETLVHKIYTS